MKFDKYLQEAASEINFLLEKYNEDLLNEVSVINKKIVPLLDILLKATKGGKRLRGTLVKLGYDIVEEGTSDIFMPALAYEIFQTAILAHDDIIDQSPLRRGLPTIYKKLGGNHYAISQTICLGDIGFFISNQLVYKSSFSRELKYKALNSFIETQYKTGIGELLDVELPNNIESIDINDILTIYEYKTAYYTIIGPLHLGAILANADEELLLDLKVLGKNLGIAFQIKDDILGVFSNENVIGKSTVCDIEEGKITILWYFAKKHGDEKQRKILDSIYGVKNIDKSDVELIQKIFIDTKALEYAEKKLEEYIFEAKNYITTMKIQMNKKKILNDLCDYMIYRKK